MPTPTQETSYRPLRGETKEFVHGYLDAWNQLPHNNPYRELTLPWADYEMGYDAGDDDVEEVLSK
jgi:hypothetical protein